MMRDRRESEEPTLSSALVALSGYRAYRAAFPTATAAWEQLGEPERIRWLTAAARVLSMPAEIDGIAWSDAARLLMEPKTWHLLLQGQRLAYEAAVRHMVALVDSGLPDDDLEATEESWKAWAQRQRPPFTPVLERLDDRTVQNAAG